MNHAHKFPTIAKHYPWLFDGSAAPEQPGPGTELKKLLAKFGVKPEAGCNCMAYVAKMNLKGVAWTRDNIDLIAEHMESEARQRGWKLPMMRGAAKMLIRVALRMAEANSCSPKP